MKHRSGVLAVVIALVLAVIGWVVYRTMTAKPAMTSAPTAATSQQPVQTVNGETVVIVDPEAQRASHIETAPIAVTEIRRERTAYATVLDLQPLLDLYDRVAKMRADSDGLRAQAAASHAEYARSQLLFNDNRNISEKALQAARAAMQADEAKLQSADAAQRGAYAMLRQQFGDVLARAAAEPASPLLRRLLDGRSMLVQVTLPIDTHAAAPDMLAIDSPDGRRIPAKMLSASAKSDPALQGVSYLYVADALLPAGTHAIAHLPSDAHGAAGLLIPQNAVVWYGGQAWAYVRTAADRFTRRFVPSDAAVEQGFIVADGFHAGEPVVIHGAQLLLSQELRPQGVATQCKDPPECDD